MRRLLVVLTLAVLAADVWLAHDLLLAYPVAWVDEAYFSAPAIDLIEHGRMGTPILAGVLPGLETHTYWMPPVYFLALAAVFKLFGIGLLQIRLFSFIGGLGVMGLTWLLGRRSGLSRTQALLPVALLGVDLVFVRGSYVGRMDMLTIALILGSQCLAIAAPAGVRSRQLIGAMVAAALAALTHPFGVLALPMLATTVVATHGRRSLKPLLIFAGVTVLVFLPWLLYAAQDWSSFVTQQLVQLHRKSGRPHDLLPMLDFALEQYGGNSYLAVILWAFGLFGVGMAAWRERRLAGLAVGYLLITGLLIWSQEMWYPLYITPFMALGVALLVMQDATVDLPLSWRTRLPTLLVCATLAALTFVPGLFSYQQECLVWGIGFLGFIAHFRERYARILTILQAAALVLTIGGQAWGFYFGYIPLGLVGMWLFAGALTRVSVRRFLPWASVAILATVAHANGSFLFAVHRSLMGSDQKEHDYRTFMSDIDAALPRGASVLFCVKPDAYLGLHHRADLTVRVCPPPGLEVEPDPREQPEYHVSFMKDVEYVVIGDLSPNFLVDRWVEKHGQEVAKIGLTMRAYHARIFRVSPEQRLSEIK